MENFKNATIALYAKRPLFLNLGLLLAITFCFIAFEFKVYIEEEEIVEFDDTTNFLFIIDEVKSTKQIPKPPKPPIKEKPSKIAEINIVEDKPEIDVPERAAVFDALGEMNNYLKGEAKPEDEDFEEAPLNPYELENQPSFEGGIEGFYKYLLENINYPKYEQRRNIEGKVYLSFVIERDGSISNIEVLKGVSEGIDEEAIRVLETAPKWEPGTQRGRAVKVRMHIPLHFILN